MDLTFAFLPRTSKWTFFAGHPTWDCICAQAGFGPGARRESDLNLKVGQIPVTFAADQLEMEQKQPAFGPIVDNRSELARILSLKTEDISPDLPVQIVSTGLPCAIIPLCTLGALRRIVINHEAYGKFLERHDRVNLLVFARETEHEGNDLAVRVFVDDTGYKEDPATGSANGNLAAYLLEHHVLGKSDVAVQVEQGYQMGRPSLLKLRASKEAGKFAIHVGGRVFAVARGVWDLSTPHDPTALYF